MKDRRSRQELQRNSLRKGLTNLRGGFIMCSSMSQSPISGHVSTRLAVGDYGNEIAFADVKTHDSGFG